jgi:hypothetical protein
MSGTFSVSRGVGVLVTDAATTALNPTDEALAVANNLRIASLSIAAYEYVTSYVSSTTHSDLRPSYLITLPAEIRLYKSSSRRR